MPKSGIVVLPSRTQPASRTRADGGASEAAGVISPAAVPTGAIEPAVHGDEIEQVAVFARGGVSPLPGGALAAVRPLEPDEQATSRRIRDIANEPVAALAAAIGEIVAAHCLGIARETVSEVRGFG
jgi:hypothetical protein